MGGREVGEIRIEIYSGPPGPPGPVQLLLAFSRSGVPSSPGPPGLPPCGMTAGRVERRRMMFRVLTTLAVLFAVSTSTALSAGPLDYSAFREGVVDGQWVGLVLDLSGTNGGASRAIVYMVVIGGNGLKTVELTKSLMAEGPSGDRMSALFAKGKLYVTNDIYLPGEPHCCPTHETIQRFGIHDGRLVREGFGTIPVTDSHSAVTNAKLVGPYINL